MSYSSCDFLSFTGHSAILTLSSENCEKPCLIGLLIDLTFACICVLIVGNRTTIYIYIYIYIYVHIFAYIYIIPI